VIYNYYYREILIEAQVPVNKHEIEHVLFSPSKH